MTEKEMIDLALAEGVSAAEMTDTKDIVFDPMFRPFCAENLCGQYGVNYCCPPDCGTPEEMKQRILAHKRALVLHTIWEIPDISDNGLIKPAKKGHNAIQLRLQKKFHEAGIPGFLVGASGCGLCSPCHLKNGEPCPHPEARYSCMSAYCIFVRKLAEHCGMDYDCGEGLLAFFGMYVFDKAKPPGSKAGRLTNPGIRSIV